MPDSGINVIFRQRGAEVLTSKPRQTVALIIKDTVHLGPNEYYREAAVPSDFIAANAAYIKRAFMGNDTKPARVLVYVCGTTGEDDDAVTYTLDDALAALDWEVFGWLAAAPDATLDELTTVALWAEEHYNAHHFGKIVFPGHSGIHGQYVVNFTADGLKSGDTEITTAAYCSRIAGFIAGTSLRNSITNAVLPDLTDCARLSDADIDEAVDDGDLTCKYRSGRVRLTRGVNSYIPSAASPTDAQLRPSKIKLCEIRDQAWFDVHELLETEYEGRYPNSYDNRIIAVTAILDYLRMGEELELYAPGSGWAKIDADATRAYLESQGIDTTEWNDDEVVRYVDGNTRVYLAFGATMLDSMEDFVVSVEMV